MQVETLKAHKWQGIDRRPGERYAVDPSDPCVRGAQTLGLTKPATEEQPINGSQVPRRRGRYNNRALSTSAE